MKKIGSFITAAVSAASCLFPLYSDAAAEEKKCGLTPAPVHLRYTAEGETMLTFEKSSSFGSSSAARAAAMPEKFDLRETGGVSPVKDQGGEGTCWAQSAVASAESGMIKYAPDIDLSEYHTAFYTYYGPDQVDHSDMEPSEIFDIGGNVYLAANLWAQWLGPVKEKNMVYGDQGFFKDKKAVDEMKYQSDYHLSQAYIFDYDDDRSDLDEINSRVKELVYSGYGVDISFQPDVANCYSSEFNSTRSDRKPRFASHSVTIVGWDDNFPRDNFVKPAEIDGAWLVKNSWGADSFDGGYLWLSYDDRSVCEFAAFVLEDAEDHTYNFHHDTYFPSQSFSAYDDTENAGASYMANIFSADTPVQAEEICIYVANAGTDYEITMYTGLTDKTDPTSGTASGTTVYTAENTGYISIPLDRDVYIPEGDFSVVVKAYNPETPFVVPVEAAMYIEKDGKAVQQFGMYSNLDQIREFTGAGESLYSDNGEDWKDVTESDYVFTDEEKEEVLKQIEKELYDGIYPDETALLEAAAKSLKNYKYCFALGDLSLAVGNISLKVLASPVDSVDFSLPTGIIPVDERLELSVSDGRNVYYSVNGGALRLYTEPIEIKGLTVVRATVDKETFTERSFISAAAERKVGDVDLNGKIDASDASFVLVHYARVSTGKKGVIPRAAEDLADYDGSGKIDACDASMILVKYGELSTSFHE